MGNISATQNIQLNLSKNLLPKMYITQFTNLIIKDITYNISQGINNINTLLITPKQVITYINKLNLLDQVVSSILSIIAQNTTPPIINTIVINAMANKSIDLKDFNNSITSINPNVNYNIIVVNNNNLINLVENLVQNNLEVASIKICFLSHTSHFVDTNIITTPPTPNTIDAITPINFQNSISECTDLDSQLSIIINNLLNSLDIKITLTNTIKTREEYLQEFQNDFNSLQNKYNTVNAEINRIDSIYDLDQDVYNRKHIHNLVKQLENIHSEIQYYVNKINALEEQPFLSPTELAMLTAPPPQKGDLDISGNQIFKANINHTQQKTQDVNKTQNINQNTNLNNDLSGNQNENISSNINLTSNKTINKHEYKSSTNKIFGIHMSTKVGTFVYICCSLLLILSIFASIFIAWRVRKTAQLVSKVKDIANTQSGNDN